MYAGNGARINQRGMSAFNVCKCHHLGYMTVTAADEIILSGTSHAMTIMGVVGDEYAPSAKFQRGIHPMVNQFAGGFCRQILHRHLIANIVAMHDMYRKSKLERGAQGMGTYYIAAMYNCLRPGCMRRGYGSSKRFGTIMTVGDDADFQFYLPYLKLRLVLNWRHNCRLINLDIRRNWLVWCL